MDVTDKRRESLEYWLTFSPDHLKKLDLDQVSVPRHRSIVEVFVLGEPNLLTEPLSDEETYSIWSYYERWRSDTIFNEKILTAFVENKVWLQSSIFNLVQHFKLKGDFVSALKYLDQMVIFEGESDDELFARSQILFKQKRYSECGRSLRRQIRRYPEFDGPKLLKLRLGYVTCRPYRSLKKSLSQIHSSKIKFPGDSQGKYKFLALAHLISPEEFDSSPRLTPYIEELVILRQQFALERKCRARMVAK